MNQFISPPGRAGPWWMGRALPVLHGAEFCGDGIEGLLPLPWFADRVVDRAGPGLAGQSRPTGSCSGALALRGPALELLESLRDGQIFLQPQDRPREGCQPCFVEHAASHLQAARIIAAGPLEELEVRLMKLSSRGDRPRAIALDLPRPEAGQANLGWHRQEHDQLEPGN